MAASLISIHALNLRDGRERSFVLPFGLWIQFKTLPEIDRDRYLHMGGRTNSFARQCPHLVEFAAHNVLVNIAGV